MNWTTLVSCEALRERLGDPGLVVVDARYTLSDPAAGGSAWFQGRLPGAGYVDLDRDLSDHARPPSDGRHPMPTAAAFREVLARLRIAANAQVVVYDASDGALAAARFWWMLRLLGHARVAEQAQHPPETRRGQRAIACVVDHDLRVRSNAQPCQHLAERRRRRHRMPAIGGRTGVVGQVAVQVHVSRARKSPLEPRGSAGGRIGQRVARVHHDEARVTESFAQGLARNQRRPVHATRSRRSRKLTSIAAVAPQMRCGPWIISTSCRRRPW